jgi:rubredoxin
MDINFIEQLMCSDCGFVYGEMLALDANHSADKICPRCGASDGALSPLECVYHTAQASLTRF